MKEHIKEGSEDIDQLFLNIRLGEELHALIHERHEEHTNVIGGQLGAQLLLQQTLGKEVTESLIPRRSPQHERIPYMRC